MKTHHRYLSLLLLLATMLLLQGCPWDDDDDDKPAPPPPPANVNGYYEPAGDITVMDTDDTTPIVISDLQGMLNDDRLMIMSVAEQLIYDGTITITDNTFSGTLGVYKSGHRVKVDNGSGPVPMEIPVTGTFVRGLSITATMTGEQYGNGSFTLNYALSNDQLADVERIRTIYTPASGGDHWGAKIYDTSGRVGGFFLLNEGAFTDNRIAPVTTQNVHLLNGCEYNYDIGEYYFIPVAGSSLYAVDFPLNSCHTIAVRGVYSGLATSLSRSSTDDVLLMAFVKTDGEFAFFAEYTIHTR